MANVPGESWTQIVDFYCELIDKYGWRQGPMLEFVTWLASTPHSRILFPSSSHAALGLATVATFQERLRRPMVYIVFSESRGFVIHWQRGQGDEVREERVSSPQAPEVFVRILDWLAAAEPKLAGVEHDRAEPCRSAGQSDLMMENRHHVENQI